MSDAGLYSRVMAVPLAVLCIDVTQYCHCGGITDMSHFIFFAFVSGSLCIIIIESSRFSLFMLMYCHAEPFALWVIVLTCVAGGSWFPFLKLWLVNKLFIPLCIVG